MRNEISAYFDLRKQSAGISAFVWMRVRTGITWFACKWQLFCFHCITSQPNSEDRSRQGLQGFSDHCLHHYSKANLTLQTGLDEDIVHNLSACVRSLPDLCFPNMLLQIVVLFSSYLEISLILNWVSRKRALRTNDPFTIGCVRW